MKIKNTSIFAAAFFFACAAAYAAGNEGKKAPEMPAAEDNAMRPPNGMPWDDLRRFPGMLPGGPSPDGMEKHVNKKTKNEFGKKREDKRKGGFFSRHFGKDSGSFAQKGMNMRPQCMLSDDDVMSLVKAADSDFAKDLKSMKKDSEKLYKKSMFSLKARLCFLKDKKSDKAKETVKKAVASVKAEAEVGTLLSKYRSADKENRLAIKSELKTSLEKLFDMRIEEQKMRIQSIEEAVAEQKKAVEDKKSSKTRIVEARLDEITGENFRW